MLIGLTSGLWFGHFKTFSVLFLSRFAVMFPIIVLQLNNIKSAVFNCSDYLSLIFVRSEMCEKRDKWKLLEFLQQCNCCLHHWRRRHTISFCSYSIITFIGTIYMLFISVNIKIKNNAHYNFQIVSVNSLRALFVAADILNTLCACAGNDP